MCCAGLRVGRPSLRHPLVNNCLWACSAAATAILPRCDEGKKVRIIALVDIG